MVDAKHEEQLGTLRDYAKRLRPHVAEFKKVVSFIIVQLDHKFDDEAKARFPTAAHMIAEIRPAQIAEAKIAQDAGFTEIHDEIVKEIDTEDQLVDLLREVISALEKNNDDVSRRLMDQIVDTLEELTNEQSFIDAHIKSAA